MPAFTLRAFFERDFSPTFLIGAAPRTFEAYADTLNAWERFAKNPPLRAIDTRALAEFKAAAVVELAAATVNKHLRHVHHLLAKAGPPGYRNRDALHVLKRAAWTKPLREFEPEPRIVSDEEIAAFLEACLRARLPRLDGVAPSAWWITLAAAAFLLAARRGTLLALKWSQVDIAARAIVYGGSIDKARRARSKPIHPSLVPLLLRIRGPWERVFPWPHTVRSYYREFTRLQDLADAGGGRWHLHDLKKTCLTSASATMDVFTLKAFGDHATIRTTEKFYATGKHRVAAAVDATAGTRTSQRTDRGLGPSQDSRSSRGESRACAVGRRSRSWARCRCRRRARCRGDCSLGSVAQFAKGYETDRGQAGQR